MNLGPLAIRLNGHSSNGHQELVEPPDLRELGASGAGVFPWATIDIEDFDPKLRGQGAIKTYDKMRKGDAQVRSTLRLVKAPMLSAQWYLEPYGKNGAVSQTDGLIKRFVEWNLFERMSRTWVQVLWEALLMFDFGFYAFEEVWEEVQWNEWPTKGIMYAWKKLGPRHPKTIDSWLYDANGGIQAMRHYKRSFSAESIVDIPIEKLLIFTLDEEAGDPSGISLLRSAYEHWYYKHVFYKIDGIQKERHGIGIPRAKLPPNFTPDDRKYALEMVQNLRTNEKAGLLELPGWLFDFLELRGTPQDALASALHHDMMIARNILAEFINLGSHGTQSSSGNSGSRAVGSTQAEFFIRVIRYFSDIVRGVFNRFGIPRLVDENFPQVDGYPELKVRRIGESADFRAMSVALRNLIETRTVIPTPELEAFILDYMDFPAPSRESQAVTAKQRIEKPVAAQTAQRVTMPAS